MAKERSRTTDYAVYLLVRLLVCILQSLSYRGACSFAAGLAWLAYRLDKRHRLASLENLTHAFGDQLTPEQRDEMTRAVYRHFCTLLIDLVHLPRTIHTTNWQRYLELPQGKPIIDGLLSGRPLFFVTGHFGNWEMGGYVLGLLGFHTYAVARPLDNPYVDDFLRQFRQRTGQGLLAKKGDFEQMQAILAEKGVIATLGDQDAGQRGLFVDFFHRPASTHKAIALLALEFDVPLVVIGTPKVGTSMRHRVVVADVIDPREYKGQGEAVRTMTQRFTTALEGVVRQWPEQYFWLHRRWKHQPPQKKAKKAA